jgi:Domain of unknown function (DUF4266)
MIIGLTVPVSACKTVEPWERAFLAKPYMEIDPNPLAREFSQHVYFSREGTYGGYGSSGGGCGCN